MGGNLDYFPITEVFDYYEELRDIDRASFMGSSSFARPPMLSAVIPLLRAWV